MLEKRYTPAHEKSGKCRQIVTVIDGCTVRLNFPLRNNAQALEQVKDTLISSFFDSRINEKTSHSDV